MNWQPIETAPRDGTHILLFADGAMIEGWYDEQYEDSYAWRLVSLDWHGCRCCSCDLETPPFWMPLPAPPEAP